MREPARRQQRVRRWLAAGIATAALLGAAVVARAGVPAAPMGPCARGDDELLQEDTPAAPASGRRGDELLQDDGPAAAPGTAEPAAEEVQQEAAEAHEKLFTESRFPSATVCRTCHPDHFREWAMSQHAYAQLSPVLQAMQGLILKLTNGTNGDFCIRCHNPVGMNLGEPLFTSTVERHPTSREGVTCVACHRIPDDYGKVSGRLFIAEGPVFAPVYGPTGNAELRRVLAEPDVYRVVTSADEPGRGIHTDVIAFPPLTASASCGTCHDVTLADNLRLEEAFSEWKNSVDAKRGISCQDCHMSTEPGLPSGYATAPAAVVGGVPTRPRKRTDHRFAGPDYSVIHPGIFPLNGRAQALATIPEWLTFDYRAGWGTPEFERTVPPDAVFPERWRAVDDRYDARAIVTENLAALDEIAAERLKILKIGYRLGEVAVDRAGPDGIRFRVPVSNGTSAHNVPTGLDNERLVFLQVTVTDRDGTVVFRSGDLDPNGDVRDQHSTYVHNGELPLDRQLFSLRSKFIVNMAHGGDREQVSPINVSVDALPFVRPETRPAILTGRPGRSRKHKRGIPPLGTRVAAYEISAAELAAGTPPFTANVKLVAGMIPINLLTVIQVVGFDYGMSPRQVGEAVSAGYQTLWERTVVLTGEAGS